jgi:hypothetical protein
MKQLERRVHAAAASIVDPETGKHAAVFVRRRSPTELILRTQGSPAFARELEKRLGVETGSIETMSTQPPSEVPRVYLAHASEDHDALAKPLAETLMAWHRSFVRRMGNPRRGQLATQNGRGPGEIHTFRGAPHAKLAAQAMGGDRDRYWIHTRCRRGIPFIAIRAGVGVSDLSPFLRTLRCPEVRLDQSDEVKALVADIHGVSRKPERGAAPRYVKTLPEG